jgi:predicted PurR-regulated permease PerM
MALDTPALNKRRDDASGSSKWTRRRDIPLAILAWTGVAAVVLWGASHIVRSLLLLAIAALLAYALVPAVKLLERVMPRFLAMLIVYLIVLSALSLLLYSIARTAIHQAVELRGFLTPSGNGQLAPLMQILQSYGITQDQIIAARQLLVSHLESIASGALPVLKGIFEGVLDLVVVAVLSIYLLLDGSRVVRWLRASAPLLQRERIQFFLNTLQRIVGGYIRGQLTLAVLIGFLVGIGMELLGVRYAFLLGVLAFVLAFIPVVGTFISATACVLLALVSNPTWTQPLILAIIVLVYFVVVHAIEAHTIGPRIVGHAIGLHPGVSIFALVAGGELFGIWGALFAAPLAGLLQAVLAALWIEWRKNHSDQFPVEAPAEQATAEMAPTVKLDRQKPHDPAQQPNPQG